MSVWGSPSQASLHTGTVDFAETGWRGAEGKLSKLAKLTKIDSFSSVRSLLAAHSRELPRQLSMPANLLAQTSPHHYPPAYATDTASHAKTVFSNFVLFCGVPRTGSGTPEHERGRHACGSSTAVSSSLFTAVCGHTWYDVSERRNLLLSVVVCVGTRLVVLYR